MSLFEKVPVPELTLYFAVNVLLPGVSPVTTEVALARTRSLPATASARASKAGSVVAPETAKLMKAVLPPWLPNAAAVTITSALPEAGMFTVTDGPAVARSV
jgi:hypothetical protein